MFREALPLLKVDNNAALEREKKLNQITILMACRQWVVGLEWNKGRDGSGYGS